MSTSRRADVTVVIATYRPLGAIIPLRALRKQTLKNFETILVTEIGSEAWYGDDWVSDVEVIRAPYIKYHSPTHTLNLGIDACKTHYVVLLTDFAYPNTDWLETLVSVLTETGASIVGGTKCSHGAADPFSCVPGDLCAGRQLLPLGIDAAPSDVVSVYPFQAAITLGNVAFRRIDALDVNGLDERFAGAYGFEDENFVRRLAAMVDTPAVLARKAIIHHYWPYEAGYKPLLTTRAMSNSILNRTLTDGEIIQGKLRAQRVPVVDVADSMLTARVAAASFPDGVV